MAAAIFITGMVMGEPAMGLMGAIFGLLIGLCFTIKDIIRMVQSKKRMRDPVYLEQLMKYGLLSEERYNAYMNEIR